MADRLRFELRNARASPVFKTGAFNHSATLPFVFSDSGRDSIRERLRIEPHVLRVDDFPHQVNQKSGRSNLEDPRADRF